MLTTLAKLEHKIGEKTYQLFLDADSKIQDVKTALYQFMGYVTEVEEKSKAVQAKATEDQVKSESVESKVEELPKQE